MEPRRSRSIAREFLGRVLTALGAFVVCAGLLTALWLCLASYVWVTGIGILRDPEEPSHPFYPLAWWDALAVWGANWWVNLWLIIGAALPTALFLLFTIAGIRTYLSRRQIAGRLMMLRSPPTRPWSSHQREPTHGDAAFVSAEDAAKRFK